MNLGAARAALDEQVRQKLEDTAHKALSTLKSNTPVDTGEAQASWEVEVDVNKVSIKNDKDYILLVNNGTSEIAPRHFIERSLMGYGTISFPAAESKD